MFEKTRGPRDTIPMAPPMASAPERAQPDARPEAKPGAVSVIGADVTITGNVAASADLQIDGRIDGDVQCGALIQGNDSEINGTVSADVARIGGTIDGAVSARQLNIAHNARITGDVFYESISIENGARIDGRLKHHSPGTLPAHGSAQGGTRPAAHAAAPATAKPPVEPIRLIAGSDDQPKGAIASEQT